MEDDPCGNHGNFQALLNFRVQAGDKVLEERMNKSAANALYTRVKQFRMTIYDNIIKNKFLPSVHQAKIFFPLLQMRLLMQQLNDEQLLICIRHVCLFFFFVFF